MRVNVGEKAAYIDNLIPIRFSPVLYHRHGASGFKHFQIGLYRLLVATGHWAIGFLKTAAPDKHLSLAVYVTRNQRMALDTLKAQKPELALFNLYAISRRLALKMAFLNFASFCLFIVTFPWARDKTCHHQRLLLRYKLKALETAISKLAPSSLYLSNDHVGEVFWIGQLYAYSGIPVTYVQHGMVKPEFPPNHFDHCFVRDAYSAEIYRDILCQNPVATVKTIDNHKQNTKQNNSNTAKYVLVALSHQFHLLATRSFALALLKNTNAAMELRIRFHPSDRFARLKYRACKYLLPWSFHHRFIHDQSEQPFLLAFKASSKTFAASSSILAEAATLDANRILWVKSLGLSWDYYDLSTQITVVEDVTHFTALLGTNDFDLAQDN